MARDTEAGRLAARVLLLYAYDPTAARLLARTAELHLELCRTLQVASEQQTAASASLERVSGSRDETERMLALVDRLGGAVGALRAAVKSRQQALRRVVDKYEELLDYRGPAKGRLRVLRSGRTVQAVQWVGPDDVRHVEPPGAERP